MFNKEEYWKRRKNVEIIKVPNVGELKKNKPLRGQGGEPTLKFYPKGTTVKYMQRIHGGLEYTFIEADYPNAEGRNIISVRRGQGTAFKPVSRIEYRKAGNYSTPDRVERRRSYEPSSNHDRMLVRAANRESLAHE